MSNALLGFGFVGILAFPVLGAVWLARQPWPLQGTRQQVVAAATAASVPYAHYAFARPDATHLALGVVPALVGSLALIAGLRPSRLLLAAACVLVVSLLALGQSQQVLHARFFGGSLVAERVQGQTLWMYKRPAHQIQLARRVFGAAAAPRFFAVPDLMGLYAIYRTSSPTWEIYPLFRRPPSFEAAEVARLEARPPDWIVLSDHALDGLDERRFSRWRPLTYAWIMAHYRPLAVDPKPDRDINVLERVQP